MIYNVSRKMRAMYGVKTWEEAQLCLFESGCVHNLCILALSILDISDLEFNVKA